MTLFGETNNRKVQTYNTYDTWHVDELYEKTRAVGERSPAMSGRRRNSKFFQHISPRWIPGQLEDEDDEPLRVHKRRSKAMDNNGDNDDDPLLKSESGNNFFSTERHRGFRRRFFLFLTEPDTSFGSAGFSLS
ncbi:hypothetical protein IV203_026169 [Nitzschia inconspicua]|uniref:Uncharacterized protein n=1 Tax=Nitzschia inconspicua TaxID=303405 RepID=A0A9K3LI21_9STRA|nr:hypothetical protein IV203_026169 [Nitzschia inconspicua]